MPRVLFALPFGADRVAGGQKMVYRFAEMLEADGIAAAVWQPAGRPGWFPSTARWTPRLPDLGADDLLMIPEDVPRPVVAEVFGAVAARRVLLCQNPHVFLRVRADGGGAPPVGWSGALCVGAATAALVRRVERIDRVHAVDPFVDPAVFRPAPKVLRICAVPRKLPVEFATVLEAFRAIHPDAADVPLLRIEGMDEPAVADAMARSAVFLSLCHREAVPLTPLEAMASGCAVVGYHGGGGLAYATADNGRWFALDEVEAVADALAAVVRGIRAGSPETAAMVEAGRATAARFTAAATRRALAEAVRDLAADGR